MHLDVAMINCQDMPLATFELSFATNCHRTVMEATINTLDQNDDEKLSLDEVYQSFASFEETIANVSTATILPNKSVLDATVTLRHLIF